MSLLKRLFGGGGSDVGGRPATEPEDFGDFRIYPEPQKDGAGFRIAARIEKDFGDETKVHHLIRADVISDRDECVAATIAKCKQLIEQQGDRIF